MLHRSQSEIVESATQDRPHDLGYARVGPHALSWHFFTGVSILCADILIVLLEAVMPSNPGDNTFPIIGAMILGAQFLVGAVVATAILRDQSLVHPNRMTIAAICSGMFLSAIAIVFGIAK